MDLFRRIAIKENVPIKNLTSFKIGDKVRYFAVPKDEEELAEVLALARKIGIRPFLLGGGTNLLVWDEGILDRLIIRLGKDFSFVRQIDSDRWEVGAGLRVDRLVRLDPEGFSVFMGLPGTVGGGIKGNAGVRVGDEFIGLADVCESLRIMDYSGQVKQVRSQDLVKGYRYTNIDGIILSSVFSLEKLKPWRGYVPFRIVVEKFPNAGCIFKNPSPEVSAGRLIDEAGFKGYRVGDAMVSRIHANFILNLGQARFADVMRIIDRVREKVRKEQRVELELEIHVLR